MKRTAETYFAIFAILILISEGTSVEIHPSHLHVSGGRETITVSCITPAPISGCQFSWWIRDSLMQGAGPVLDLSLGARSPVIAAHLQNKYGYKQRPLLGYSYSGRGLANGTCGIRMEVEGLKYWMISCRVKTRDAWEYQWTDLAAEGWNPVSLPHTVEPREMVVLKGGRTTVLLKAREALNECSIKLPDQGWALYFNEGPSSAHSLGRRLYHGAGLAKGECGIALSNITDEDNGLVRIEIKKNGSRDIRLTPLIVARPPTPPVLTVTVIGDVITATCMIKETRPAPKFTWSLGEDVIRQDSKDDSPGSVNDPWRWPWSAGSTSQILTFKLLPKDVGKRLRCVVSHPALPRRMEAAEVVSFRGCGQRRTNSGSTLIYMGDEAKVGEFPWHVAIYEVFGQEYVHMCGGSLITPQIVLTAAHCFWDETGKKLKEASRYWVAAGRLTRDWKKTEPNEQKKQVARIDPNMYIGRDGKLRHDIALAFLKKPMLITPSVGLICVDWGTRMGLVAGDTGEVAGWGITENQTQSAELRYISLPFVPRQTCYDSLPPTEIPALTLDKFCAGFVNAGKSVCGGDSGGGLVFLNRTSNSYVIMGIVSNNFKPHGFKGECYADQYTAFTRISDYMPWITNKTSEFL